MVTVRPGLRWLLREGDAEQVILQLTGRTMSFPAYCGPALRLALDEKGLTP